MRVHINSEMASGAARPVRFCPSLLAGVARATARVDSHRVDRFQILKHGEGKDKFVNYIDRGKLPLLAERVEVPFTNHALMTE